MQPTHDSFAMICFLKNLRIAAYEQIVRDINQALCLMSGMVATNLYDLLPSHLALCVVIEVGDIKRFSNAEQLLKFAGLDHADSPCRDVVLQSCLLEATLYCINRYQEYQTMYSHKLQTMGCPKLALKDTCRKLVRTVFSLLSTNQPFRARGG